METPPIPQVEIVASPPRGMGPMDIQLEPVLTGLREPIRCTWYFGDGEQSVEKIPPRHHFQVGRYSVVLQVEDASGRRYTASLGIDAASPG